MVVNFWKVGASLVGIPTLLVIGGCATCKASEYRTVSSCHRHSSCHNERTESVSADLPPDAKPGECYAKVFVPEEFSTRTETVVVRDASERLEIVPAQYEWVEEQVLVKQASCRLEEIPAQFETRQMTVQTDAGHTGWHVEKTPPCASNGNVQAANDMYCLVSHEPAFKTIDTQVQVKPATVREIPIPAEYQTVRRQKLVCPATTRRVCIPAEFASVEKTFKSADSRVEWRRVDCIPGQQTQGINTAQGAQADAGQ